MIPDVIARLLGISPAVFSLVEGTAELASRGTGAPAALPAAYVFVGEEGSAENERLNGVLQRTEVDLKVVIITGNVSDASGGAAAADLEALKAAVRTALLGWQPTGADDIITSVGGELVRARDGLVWWEMTFATAFYLEA